MAETQEREEGAQAGVRHRVALMQQRETSGPAAHIVPANHFPHLAHILAIHPEPQRIVSVELGDVDRRIDYYLLPRGEAQRVIWGESAKGCIGRL